MTQQRIRLLLLVALTICCLSRTAVAFTSLRPPVSTSRPSIGSFSRLSNRINNAKARLTKLHVVDEESLVGDYPALFSMDEQKIGEWVQFTVATGIVLFISSYAWFLPDGPHLGDAFLSSVQSVTGTTDPAITITGMLAVFAISHSGLAGLRPYGSELIGQRAWRVIFALVSLPLALSCLSYFVNHAHDGTHLWNLPFDDPYLHTLYWITNFVSFLFLYPSSFNLLEIAAIQKPQLHLWAPKGIIRITRHPQCIGQIMWCLAHSAYLGTTTAVAASLILTSHHVYSSWHGDRRLRMEHPDSFERVEAVTSTVPFAAILEGRQELPKDYYKEFLTGPYALVVGGTIGAYIAHPYMISGAELLHW